MDEKICECTIEPWEMGVDCIVCGETVVLGQYSIAHTPTKMCQRCKRAILYIRNQIELVDEETIEHANPKSD